MKKRNVNNNNIGEELDLIKEEKGEKDTLEIIGIGNLLYRRGNIIKVKLNGEIVDYYTPYSVIDIDNEYVELTVVGQTKITDLDVYDPAKFKED